MFLKRLALNVLKATMTLSISFDIPTGYMQVCRGRRALSIGIYIIKFCCAPWEKINLKSREFDMFLMEPSHIKAGIVQNPIKTKSNHIYTVRQPTLCTFIIHVIRLYFQLTMRLMVTQKRTIHVFFMMLLKTIFVISISAFRNIFQIHRIVEISLLYKMIYRMTLKNVVQKNVLILY